MSRFRSSSRRLRSLELLRLAALGAILLAILGLSCVAATADEPPRGGVELQANPGFDVGAVIRRGAGVQHVDATAEPTFEQSIEQVVGQSIEQTPPDDRDKWFVSILTSKNCAYCERLLEDWKASPYLQALGQIDAAKQKESWSHLTVYRAGDATQRHRWEKIAIGGYPTVIVQAPASGKFGPATDVVFQKTGYDGNAAQLLADARAAIKLRIEKFAPELLKQDPDKPKPGRRSLFGGAFEASDSEPLAEGTNSLGPKPVTDGPDLLPTVDKKIQVPPGAVIDEASEEDADAGRGVLAELSDVYGEADGATGGNLWWMLALAAATLLQQFLDRRYPGGPDDPATPKLAGRLQKILTLFNWVLGPQRAAKSGITAEQLLSIKKELDRNYPAAPSAPAEDQRLLDRLEDRVLQRILDRDRWETTDRPIDEEATERDIRRPPTS